MKKLLTPLACLLLAPLSAQTIEYGHLGPFGVTTTMHQMTAPAALPALAEGTGVTWDLSGITLQPIGTMSFSPAAGTPHADEFPSANWVWAHTVPGVGSGYFFLDIGSTGMDLLDRNVGLPNPVVYTDPVQIMKFPLAYGESFTDEYSTDGTVRHKHWTYAGHGTVILPIGTVTGAALVVSEEGDITFWNPEPLYPLMIADDGSAMFYLQNNVGVEELSATSMRAWPNPCQDVLHLPDAPAGGTWKVIDAQGRTLAHGIFGNGHDGRVDVGTLAPGGYLLVVDAATARKQVRFVKE